MYLAEKNQVYLTQKSRFIIVLIQIYTQKLCQWERNSLCKFFSHIIFYVMENEINVRGHHNTYRNKSTV